MIHIWWPYVVQASSSLTYPQDLAIHHVLHDLGGLAQVDAGHGDPLSIVGG